VLVVGYDDIPLASFFHPALSTVRQPIENAGEQLVESLLEQLAGRPPVSRQLVTELVVRESSSAALGRHESPRAGRTRQNE